MPSSDVPADLPPEEQGRPEVLDRRLDRLRGPDGQALIAELAAAAATGTLALEEARLWEALQARAITTPELRAHLEAASERLDALGHALEDPLARFDRLTGAGGASSAPASARPFTSARAERPAHPRAAYPQARWRRTLVAASVVLVGVLVAARIVQRPSPYAFTDEELSQDELGPLRGTAAPAEALDAQYVAALRALDGAQRSFLGRPLAPNAARLRAATQQLRAVWQAAPTGSFVRLEAAYRLGKAHLLLGDPAGAAPLLQEVVAGSGRYAAEATALLARSRS